VSRARADLVIEEARQWLPRGQPGAGWGPCDYQALTLPRESDCGACAQVIASVHFKSIDCGEVITMLAEKFFLVLETLRSHADDRSVVVNPASRYIPIKLPPAK
jgi:hypothetical protein